MTEAKDNPPPQTSPSAKPSFQETRKLKKEQFKPMEHQPPRYKITGQQKQTHSQLGQDNKNILQQSVRIPEWWANARTPTVRDGATAPLEPRTLRQLKQERKGFQHPSYDLDGDGIVGARDYFLAKRFDLDQDGRLNTAEKDAALRALESGYENKFFWNVEETGAHRGQRLMQVRGQFVDGEDFLPVSGTYPRHPLSNVPVETKTAGELKQKQKNEIMANLKKTKEQWDKANPASVPQRFILSEFFVDQPKHASMKQLKDQERLQARQAAGLGPTTSDIKEVNKDPTVAYVADPYIKTNTDLAAKMKEYNLMDLSKFGQNKHAGETERLKAREDCILRLAHSNQDRITYKELVEKRKKDMVEYNMKTFGNVAIGIHGKELPKFSQTQNVKEYWKLATTYRERPENNSALELRRTQKYWAQPDCMLLSDVKDSPAPVDVFKKTHTAREFKKGICEKVNGINHFHNEAKDTVGESIAAAMHSRWTEVVHYFSKKKSAYEEDPCARTSLIKYEQLPLPSSFSANGVFDDPLNKIRHKFKPQTSEAKLGKQSVRTARGQKEQYRPPKENLLTRVASKKTISSPEIDMRRTMTAGIRTGGFSGS